MNEKPSFYDLIADEPEAAEVQDGFAVRDLQSADWCLSKALYAQSRINEVEAYFSAKLAEVKARAEARLAKETANYRRTRDAMAAFLEPWVRERLAGEKRKSMYLLSGRVGFRRTPDRLEVRDEAAAVYWLKENDLKDRLRIKEEVDKRAVMADVNDGASLPEGCELVAGQEKFYLDEGKGE